MRPDNNWRETRATSQDISDLLEVPVNEVEKILMMIEDLIIHKFIETIDDIEECCNKDISIELPYLGSLIVSFDEQDRMTYSFVIRNSFNKKLRSAYLHQNSPLIEYFNELLSNKLVNAFDNGGQDE